MDTTARLTSAVADRYRIVREIARGGMATVYLAVDVRHDRQVALKVLTPELHAVLGAERFLSEIALTARLQHPNLVPLFDSGVADGCLYYVMPFVEGESLRARLRRERQLPVSESVEIAVCVGHALEYAHRHGVIHRDLKPENILLVEGQPLVADFGIALAMTNAAGERLTQSGLSLGTPQYMSPEQAAGDRSLDARTDVYSLGVVLYEMLTGDPPHAASSTQAVLAKVLTETPTPVHVCRPTVPDELSDAVARSLEKIPADRFASAHEMWETLARAARTTTSSSYSASRVRGPRRRGWTARVRDPLVLASGLVLLAAGVAALWKRPESGGVGRQVIHSSLTLTIGNGAQLIGDGSPLALSPDGRHIAYVAAVSRQRRRLFVRPLNQSEAFDLRVADNVSYPAFSPDGLWIAFMAGSKLMRIPTTGGVALPLADVPGAAGVSWGAEGVIVVGRSRGGGVVSVPAGGGALRELTELDSTSGETGHRWPIALADGSVFYTSWKGDLASARIAVTSIDGNDPARLDMRGSSPLMLVDGWLVYGGSENRVLEFGEVQGFLRAIRYDRASRRVVGAPVEFMKDVLIGSGGAAKIALSPVAMMYLSGADTARVLLLIDSLGRSAALIPRGARYRAPRFSPDGKRIAYSIAQESGADVYIYDIASRLETKLTTSGTNGRPTWAPDGSKLVFVRETGTGGAALWWQATDAASPAELLLGTEHRDPFEGLITRSRDGDALIYRTDFERPGSGDIMYRRLGPDTLSRPVAATEFMEVSPSISPDGRWIAYASNRTGASEIYVQAFPGPGPAHAISNGGGIEPVWSALGKRLYYRRGDEIVEVMTRVSPRFEVVAQRTVLTRVAEQNFAHANYDVSRTQQFVMVGLQKEPDVSVILNWIEQLRERLRAAK